MRAQILVIDTDKASRELVLNNLADVEADLVSTPSYLEGLGFLAEGRFDVVIVDYSLADEGAHIVCSVVQDRDDDTALIVTSGIQSRDLEMRIRSYSPAIYLVKPFAVLDLKTVVVRILAWKRTVS